MTHHTTVPALLLALLLPAAQGRAALRGDIQEDTVWQGVVKISADVSISGATVRVMPGTRIVFDKPATLGTGPLILLNSPILLYARVGQTARLILAGTPEQPIIIETAPDKLRGSIVAGRSTSASVFARHVIFRSLGGAGGVGITEPALQVQLGAEKDDLWLSHCRFEDCGPVEILTDAPTASVHIAQCTFTGSTGDWSLDLAGSSLSAKVVAGNRADAAFRIGCSQALVSDNVLIGPTAGIRIPGATSEALTITGNYVHCAGFQQWGSAALTCDAPATLLTRNVLRGGNHVVQVSPRTVTGNVLIGSSRAAATHPDRSGTSARKGATVNIVVNCPPGTVLADNLFLGAATAALSAGRSPENLRIAHNVFDGWNAAQRAIEFHAFPHAAAGVVIEHNVFARYRLAPVVDLSRRPGTVLRTTSNLFVEVPATEYEDVAGHPDSASGDRRIARWAEWSGSDADVSEAWADQIEELLLNGAITPAEARLRWFAAYPSAPESPDTHPAQEPSDTYPAHESSDTHPARESPG